MNDLTQFAEDAVQEVGDTTPIITLARQLWRTEQEIERLETELKDAKKRRLDLSQRQLPDAFTDAGTDRLGLPESDMDLVIKPWCHANLPKDPEKRAAAIDWLEGAGHEGMLRTSVTVELQRGDHERARALENAIRDWARENQVNISPVTECTVPWNTLTAFVKEQLRAGEVLPLETLGATVGRVAEFQARKKIK